MKIMETRRKGRWKVIGCMWGGNWRKIMENEENRGLIDKKAYEDQWEIFWLKPFVWYSRQTDYLWLLMARKHGPFWCPTYQKYFDFTSLLCSVILKETCMEASWSPGAVCLCRHFHFMNGNWTQFGLADISVGIGSWSCLPCCVAQQMSLLLKVCLFVHPTPCNYITPPAEHKYILNNLIGLFTDNVILIFRPRTKMSSISSSF